MAETNEQRAQKIVAMWDKASKIGLGGKRFDGSVQKTFEDRFERKILAKLNRGDAFTRADERKTKRVAKDVGRVCAMMAEGPVVNLHVFQDVFRLLKKHAACPGRSGAGRGTWCDVPLG
jgi:hypothetical protein